MGNSTFLFVIEIIGTFAFAVSGIRTAANKRFDLFGAYVVGLVTAIGGGTIRDLMLDITPFWMLDPIYLIVTGISLALVIILGKYLSRLENTFFIFDTIGLALFVVVGMQKTIALDYPFWVAIIMGTLTGAFGGILRDILVNEEPLIFRKDIYASACIIGGTIYWLAAELGITDTITQSAAAAGVILTRFAAVKFHWALPTLKGENK
ncbi:MAG: trimeric intracellular cation channel family protein [Bacteroidales bacterium]